MDLRYQHIEGAMAAMFRVSPEHIKALRARLRHLRNLGVPELPKVGSGVQLSYRLDAAREIYLALEFSRSGISPNVATAIVKGIRDKLPGWAEIALTSESPHVIACTAETFGGNHGEDIEFSVDLLALQSLSDRVNDDQFRKSRGHSVVIYLSEGILHLNNLLKKHL
jgi:hypothetical protein